MFKSLYTIRQHPDRRLGEAVLNWKGALVALFIMIFYQTVLPEILSYMIMYLNNFTGREFGVIELNVMLQLSTLAILVFFFGRFFWENTVRFFREFKAVYLWGPLLSYFIAMAMNMVVQMILFMIRGEMQSTTNNDVLNDMVLQQPMTLVFLTVVLAPLVEESIFRAGLCRPMTASNNYFVKAMGVIISVALFSLMHVYQYAFFAVDASGAISLTFNADEFLSILSYIPMAVGFVICSSLCKNFWGSVMGHMVTNAVAVGLMILMNLLPVLAQ